MKPKVIKSVFMLIIATCFSSLCLTFAWFTSHLIQDNQSSNISLTGMEGKLYYYNGNRNADGFWCGFLEKEAQAGLNKGFTEFDPKSQQPNNPFYMQSAKPSSRFLFYFEARVKDTNQESFQVNFGATDWINTPAPSPDPSIPASYPKLNTGENICLSRAIHLYAVDAPIEKPAVADSNNPMAEANQVALDWCDSLMPAVDPSVYTKDKFNQTTETNTTGEALLFTQTPYTFAKGKTYLIPFLMEFTNDKDTFCSPTGNPNEFKIDEVKGASNVYMGMTFTFTEVFLTHIDPPKPSTSGK